MAETRDEFADEIQRLMTAVQDWARRTAATAASTNSDAASTPGTKPDPPAARPGREAPGEHEPHPSTEHCLPWCPICQFANVLRGEHPELAERLTDAATAVTAAMKAIADSTLTRAQGEPGTGPQRPRPGPRVQRIPLNDADSRSSDPTVDPGPEGGSGSGRV